MAPILGDPSEGVLTNADKKPSHNADVYRDPDLDPNANRLCANREAFPLCVSYDLSVEDFKRFIHQNMEKQNMNFDIRS